MTLREAPPSEAEAAQPAVRGRMALAFIFITVWLDAMALGMTAPVLPTLVRRFVSGNTSEAAAIYGLFNTVFALMQFFFSPVLGSLSDRFGRRPLILLSNLGLGLNYVLLAWSPNLAWLFVGRVISGITGASFGTASAYIADTHAPEKRAGAFGLLGAAFGLGFMVGPALGGVLGEYSPKLPFVVAAVFSLANALYGLLVLPESLPVALRSGFSWRRANPIGALGMLRRHPELTGLSAVVFLSNLAQVSLPTAVVLYVIHRYGWTPNRIGLTLGIVGVALAVVQVVVLRPFVKAFGNRAALVGGLLFGVAGLAAVGLAPTGQVLWLSIPVLALWGLSGPAAQGLMTRHVNASEQGQLQGANASLTGISELLGPTVFSLTFAWFVRPGQPMALSGAPFVLGAVLLVVAALIGWAATMREEDEAAEG